MKILVVGAGAIGQVFAHHAALAGADVSFFVRDKYVDETRQGFNLYPLNRANPRQKPVELKDFDVYSDIDDIARKPWDQVYLCIPSTGLRGEWFENFVQGIADAILVNLTPGLDDRQYIHAHFNPDHVVTGMLSFISYPGPLPNENLPTPGTVYWFPPLSPTPFEGNADAVKSVVKLLKRGGLPAKIDQKLASKSAYPSAILISLVAALELEDWSFKKLKNSARLNTIIKAIHEASNAIAAHTHTSAPLAMRAISPRTLKLIIPIAPKVIPLDIEAYLRLHFLKVRPQTIQQLSSYLHVAKKHQLPHNNLQALLDDLHTNPTP